MQRVSYRTLFLLVMLLGLIVVQQRTAQAVSVRPDAIWLACEPNTPGPEWIGSAAWRMLSDTNDPGPEVALRVRSMLCLSDEPNDPGPEFVLGIQPALRLTEDANDPGPEFVRSVLPALRLNADPNDPGPEVTLALRSAISLSEDPNDPGPECI
jgi:hypothetical protein